MRRLPDTQVSKKDTSPGSSCATAIAISLKEMQEAIYRDVLDEDAAAEPERERSSVPTTNHKPAEASGVRCRSAARKYHLKEDATSVNPADGANADEVHRNKDGEAPGLASHRYSGIWCRISYVSIADMICKGKHTDVTEVEE